MAASGTLPLAISIRPSPGATQPPNATPSGSVEPIDAAVSRDEPTPRYETSYSVRIVCIRLIAATQLPGDQSRPALRRAVGGAAPSKLLKRLLFLIQLFFLAMCVTDSLRLQYEEVNLLILL
eukprot:scaffold11172_cov122-Isochrysis_galbana.AAC.4